MSTRTKSCKKTTELTAIIVNDKGEVFTHWASACSIGVGGWETYYTVPQFAKTRTIIVGEDDFKPGRQGGSRRPYYTINKPYVFSSVRTAEIARKRMYGSGRTAIVT